MWALISPTSSPVDTSSSLSSSSSSSSSTSSSTKPHSVEAREAEVRLLPPLLKDQAWGVHAQEAFLLFCLALGPSDLQIHWLINGHMLDTPIMEHRLPLGQKEILVSSWLREGALIKDARYHCVAEASTGSDTSEVDLRLTIGDEESVPSRDLNQWRGALTEHEQLLKRWAEAWESCDGH
ncbi:hypothetical protein CesoFtcFv8_024223 [Champsocephalus esox]|uniref:Ig-like domain-containing protein n=1 Tax=Champsocephalus esox TaxID=159716 RepID=A0AAN8B6J6_9TELE|nr:hypothetical protein CesoFtcFv8_024223 [Champsocephalus esox]